MPFSIKAKCILFFHLIFFNSFLKFYLEFKFFIIIILFFSILGLQNNNSFFLTNIYIYMQF